MGIFGQSWHHQQFYEDGGRYIFLELPIQSQKNIDRLENNETFLDEFIAQGLNDDNGDKLHFAFVSPEIEQKKLILLGTAILEAKKYGIKIYAADEKTVLPKDIFESFKIVEEWQKNQQSFIDAFNTKNAERLKSADKEPCKQSSMRRMPN